MKLPYLSLSVDALLKKVQSCLRTECSTDALNDGHDYHLQNGEEWALARLLQALRKYYATTKFE